MTDITEIESPTNEKAIYRVVAIANVVSWVILAIYLLIFAGDLVSLITGPVNWPTQIYDILKVIANVLYTPAMGLFYFLVLQGVSQGLYLGLDIYYDLHPDEDDEVAA
jgi:hypothetical protein